MSKNKNYSIFDKYMLSDDEIDKAIQKGLLSENIYTLLTYKKADGYYHKQSVTPGYLQSLGIKLNFTQTEKYSGYNYNHESFYITDFYLICVEGKLMDWRFLNKGGNQEEVYDHPDSIKVIPLNKVEYIKIEYGKNTKGSYSAVTKEVKKSPVKGAAIGAVVAGAHGAVVGAAMNSGTKTKTIIPAGSYNYNEYTLRIKLEECDEYIFEKFYKVDVKYGEEINPYEWMNTSVQDLIEQSKKKKSNEEKKQIVSNTISQGKSKAGKEKVSNVIAFIIFFVIICALVLAFQSFC
ncbi:MAG: hypothetical protein VZS44_00760 [Bacilli bacterium]|nr:hypothetical protein [Bacilli bacterium]